MTMKRSSTAWLVVILLVPASVLAQGPAADYPPPTALRPKEQHPATNVPGPATWIEKTSRFWYVRSVRGGREFVLFDADTRRKRPAFDHQRLADSLSAATGKRYTAVTLPFTTITFTDGERTLGVTVDG